MSFDFDIVYKPGKESIVADSLSRRLEDIKSEMKEQKQLQLLPLSVVIPNVLEVLHEDMKEDQYVQSLIAQIQVGKIHGDWKVMNGLLYHKGKLFPNSDSLIIPIIVQEMHTSMHEGYEKTIVRVKQDFRWKGMTRSMHNFIRQCDTCQKNKKNSLSPKGLLHPLPIPDRVWKTFLLTLLKACLSQKG